MGNRIETSKHQAGLEPPSRRHIIARDHPGLADLLAGSFLAEKDGTLDGTRTRTFYLTGVVLFK